MADGRRYSVNAALLALLAVIAGGMVLINLWISQERERDLRQWEARLGLVADTRAEALARVIGGYRRDLDELAGNASLQMYLGQVSAGRADANAATDGDAGAAAQADYLRNLILTAADRAGYLSEGTSAVPADVLPTRSSGLALLDAELRPVAVTPGLKDVERHYGARARAALSSATPLPAELSRDEAGRPVLVFAVPVRPVLGTGSEADVPPVGVLVGVRNASQELFPLITEGPSFAEDSEALLLTERDGRVLYLSPGRDGTGALQRTSSLDTENLAEVAAIKEPGRFVALDNYRGQPVLQVSRAIRGQDWVLVQQVDADQALSSANERRAFLVTAGSLLLIAIVALAIAAWRHGSGVRAQAQADQLRQQSLRLERQTELLHTVTDHIDALTLLVDRDSRVLFTNQATAEAVHGDIAGLLDNPLPAALGTAVAQELADGIGSARQSGQTVHRYAELALGGVPRSYQVSFTPVKRIGDHDDVVLVVLSDVTELQQARQRHEDLLGQLVAALASAVDLHDPWSGRHAAHLAEVADAIAVEMGLGAAERETLNLAATLANIGKIMIPAELLTRPEPLGATDQAAVRQHVQFSLDLLRDLKFEGPVLETIAQKQELLDGSGYPRGLTGAQMTLPGRILSVANAFVALVSARAYRPGLGIRPALEQLLEGADTRYDRRVLAALFHVAENRKDWSAWTDRAGPGQS